ncbi:MAG: phosphotransferase [Chloroflexi bacterium]|nr:phosphotransferase [Chloroflexota bacterium]MCL5274538.1 phosphotransferase [Chloroflexota bacterium]
MELSSKPIALGRTAEIYAWDDGCILKLLRPGFPHLLIEQEERITSAIVQAGIAAPKIGGLIEVNGRPGILYERIDGPALTGLIEQHPFGMRRYAELLARLHAALHMHTVAGLPRQKAILARQVQAAEVLPLEVRNSVLYLLDRLPDGNILCHNDFHPLNVLMGLGGPVIIDWESASLGNPCADVARTSLTVALGRPTEGFPNVWMKKLAEIYLLAFTSVYLARYRSFAHDRLPNLRAWQTVQAAAKVQYEAPANQGMWMEVIKKGLKDGTDRIG